MSLKGFLVILIALGLFVTAGTVIATLTPPDSPPDLINVSDNTTFDDQADIAIDSSGDLHIIWVSLVDLDGDGSLDSTEYFYTKRSSVDGSVIIPNTQVTSFGGDTSMFYNHRPHIAISGAKVHVVGQSLGCINYLQINGADGSVTVDPSIIDCTGWEAHPEIALDSSGNVHIVYDTGAYGNWYDVNYAKLDGDGNPIGTPMRISTDDSVTDRSRPSIAIDPSGNAHIVWTGDAWDEESAVWYSMVDKDGNVAIGPTRITNDGCVQSSVFASSNSEIEVVLQQSSLYNYDYPISIFSPLVIIHQHHTQMV